MSALPSRPTHRSQLLVLVERVPAQAHHHRVRLQIRIGDLALLTSLLNVRMDPGVSVVNPCLGS